MGKFALNNNWENYMGDWRLTNQEKYIKEAQLIYSKYTINSKSDHAHCEFCWDKFGEEDNTLHFGYCTLDKYRWICEQCYNDFKDQFRWIVVKST